MTNIERTETVDEHQSVSGRVWIEAVESFVDDHGLTFIRRGYTVDGDTRCAVETRHFTATSDDVLPAVRCGTCRGDAFRIMFGSYECIAVCVACGMAAVVYDG